MERSLKYYYGKSKGVQARHRHFARYVKGNRVLDVGLLYSNRYIVGKGYEIWGLDIEICEVPNGYYNCVYDDVKKVDKHFDPNFFDTVILGGVLSHVKDPYGTLCNVRKILKPGGVLIVSVPNPVGFPMFIAEYFCSKKWFYDPEHTMLYTPLWLEKMLTDTGFKVFDKYGISWITHWRVPVNLGMTMTYVAR